MAHTGILFMQSQDFFGADSQIHASIMRHLPRDRFEVHCAVPTDRRRRPAASTARIRDISDVRVRLTDFGPSLDSKDRCDAVLSLVRGALPMLWSLVGLVVYVRRHRIRIVHCTEKPRDAVLGRLVARLGGAKLVIHVHVKAEMWLSRGVQRAMTHADALIGVSEFVAQSIRDLIGENAPVWSVLNGLEVDEWEDVDVDIAERRAEFGFSPTEPMLLSASRLFRWKGQHHLLAAIPTVKQSFPNVKVLIVGADDPRSVPGEGSYSDELRAICDELDLVGNVVFAGWRSDVRELMTACDVYAMPSFEEPFGMVFIEAMFLRRPVVALANGGTLEVVEHERSGLLSPPGDTERLAAYLIRLLGDPELRARMGEHGHRRVAEFLNAQRMAGDVARVYAEVAPDR